MEYFIFKTIVSMISLIIGIGICIYGIKSVAGGKSLNPFLADLSIFKTEEGVSAFLSGIIWLIVGILFIFGAIFIFINF
jgi:hypothetical protein